MSQPLHPTVPATPRGETGQPTLKTDTARVLMAAALLAGCTAGTLASWGGLGLGYFFKAAVLLGLFAALMWHGLFAPPATLHPHARFGAANRVTLLRLGMTALLAALLGETLSTAAWRNVVVVATASASFDAVDGWLARRSGLASAFGARFDMESDAAFTLVLSALVFQSGQVGVWVLASGLMRYAFVAAARRWPWLAGPLRPSRRRQTACVVQIATLIACLSPAVPPALAAVLAATSLALLAWSFAVDVRHLHRARPAPTPPET